MIALDILLIILTSACILYCMILNRRIVQIQNYRTQMLKLFKEFDQSVIKAEMILKETKKIAPKTSEIFDNIQKESENQKDEINKLLYKGDKLAEELETIIISGNKLVVRFNEIGIALKNDEKSDENLYDSRQASLDINDFGKIQKRQLSQHDYYEIIQNKNLDK